MRTLHADNSHWSEMLLCSALAVPRNTLYYRSTKRDEQLVKEAIQTTAGAWPRYGSERICAGANDIAAQMKRDGAA